MGILRRAIDAFTLDRAPASQAFAAAAEVATASPRFETSIDSGVLYGTPTLEDYIYGRGKISRQEALAVPAIKRARDLICGEIGQFPLLLIGPDGKPTDWNLLSQPEAGVARSVTVTRTIEDMLLSERAWWKVTHVGWHNRPAEVVRLDAETVTVQPKYVSYPEGQALVWPDISGLIRIDSPNGGLLTASTAIRAYIALARIAMRAVDGAPPVDWFTPVDDADPVEDDEIEDILNRWLAARQQRITGYVPAALKYNRDGFNPEQLQMAQAREFMITEIARLTGIDAEELSVSTTSRTYFNSQDRRRQRLESVLGPYMTAVEGRLSMNDVTPVGYKTVFDTSSYLRLDDLAAAQSDEILIRSHVLTPDEGREKRGLEPLGLPAPAALPAAQEVASNMPNLSTFTAEFADADDQHAPAITFEAADFAVDREKRTLTGVLLPFGEVSRPARDPNTGKSAKFSFAAGTVMLPDDPADVVLNYAHDGKSLQTLIGVATELSLQPAGVVAKFSVAETPEGDRVLALAAARVLKSFSAEVEGEFAAGQDGIQHAKAAIVTGAAVVPKPAFAGAHITSVAASAADNEGNNMKCTKCGAIHAAGVTACDPVVLAAFTAATPVAFSKAEGDALMAQVAEQAAEIAQLKDIKLPVGPGTAQFQVTEEPIYRFAGDTGAQSGFDFATDLLAAGKDGDGAALARLQQFTAETMHPHFADQPTTTADTAAVNPSQYRPDMFLGQAPTPKSPLYDCFYKSSLSSVTPFFWSKLDRTNTDVGVADHTEDANPESRDLVTAAGTTVTPTAVSGRVHITREVADQGGNPVVSGLIRSEFDRSFSIALETKTAALIAAASVTELGGTIAAGATGLVAGAAVEAGLLGLQFLADGFRFTRAFGHVELYTALALAVTGNDEKVYPIINPANRDGVTGNKFSYIDIAGYQMTPAASLGAAASGQKSYVADPNAVHVWNSGLTRLDKLTETVAGWDMAVFAYFAGVVYDVTGLRKITYDSTS